MKIDTMKSSKICPLLLSLSLLAAACEDKTPKAGPVPQNPVENDSTKVPEPPINQPGQDSLPSMPVELYGRIRMQWAPTDYREAFYGVNGLPVRVIQENQYLQGTDETRKISYDFFYDAQQNLTKLKLDNGAYVTYSYEGKKVIETKEYAKDHKLIVASTYAYAGDKITQIRRVNSYKNVETQIRLFYDERGNLTEYREYAQNRDTGQFETYSSTRFSQYDNKRNVENLWMVYPFLPGYIFAGNNAGSVRFYFFDGNAEKEVPGRKTVSYEYLKNGYPARKLERGAKGRLETTYSYKGL